MRDPGTLAPEVRMTVVLNKLPQLNNDPPITVAMQVRFLGLEITKTTLITMIPLTSCRCADKVCKPRS